MRIAKSIHFLVIGLLVILSSCASEEAFRSAAAGVEADGPAIEISDATQSYEYVASELWIYFETFEKEAKQRDLFVDLKGGDIHLNFENIVGNQTGYTVFDPAKSITFLTLNKNVWNTADSSFRELIMFHHLGLIKLGKTYNNDSTVNGICESILREDIATCADNYNTNTREAYLDELFGN
ncbi:MAG: hypothetical protein ACI94Y_002035 [Maribacter sp.]|jgi:hypothetical protein